MATEKLGRSEIQSIDDERLARKFIPATIAGDKVTVQTLDASIYSLKRVNLPSESNRTLTFDLESTTDGSVKRLSGQELRQNVRSIEIEPRLIGLVPAANVSDPDNRTRANREGNAPVALDAVMAAEVKELLGNLDKALEAFLASGREQRQLEEAAQQQVETQAPSRGMSRSR